jgi:ribosomal subunit interface protein
VDLIVKSRGVVVEDRLHDLALHKLEKLTRLERRIQRVEIEVIAERHRPEGHRRLEAALSTPRRTFRAHAEGPDVEHALDRIVQRLDRQLRDHHGKRAKHKGATGNRLESAG